MTIYNLPSIIKKAVPKVMIPLNILKGFEATGIQPFNRDIFTEDKFLPWSVTDQQTQKVETITKAKPTNILTDTPNIDLPAHGSTNNNESYRHRPSTSRHQNL